MHENNPFQNIKDYWGSYYSSITEGAVKDTLNDMGYYFTDEGEHAGKWVHEKTGKALSTNHAMEIAAERANRKKKKKGNKEADAAGPNPTDKDARKQGEESTHSEEVEHDGEQLDELSDDLLKRYIASAQKSKKAAKMRGREIQMSIGQNAPFGSPLRDPNSNAYWRAEQPAYAEFDRARKRQRGQRRAFELLGRPIGENLFHKDSDRLLREHIRAEYEARGIYPTTREVQETYNMVMDLLEKTSASKRDEVLAQQHGTSGTANGMILTKRKIRRDRAGNPPEDHGRPLETARQENSRQLKHLRARGVKTRISPSSPAREKSQVEIDTRKGMGEGESPAYQRLKMFQTGH